MSEISFGCLAVLVYFGIGVFINYLVVEDGEELRTGLVVFWPLVFTIFAVIMLTYVIPQALAAGVKAAWRAHKKK